MAKFERYRHIKINITKENYQKVVNWFKDVEPGSFIDFCYLGENNKVFCLINKKGERLELNNPEDIFIDETSRANSFNSHSLKMSIEQLLRKDGRYIDISRFKSLELCEANYNGWETIANSSFFRKNVENYQNYPNGEKRWFTYEFDRRRATCMEKGDTLIAYLESIRDLVEQDKMVQPSQQFIMGDIGVFLVEKNSITISFDIRMNVYESAQYIEAYNDVKDIIDYYSLRKSMLNHYYNLLKKCREDGEELYLLSEIPFFSFAQARKLLIEMFFSTKGIVDYQVCDDLQMINVDRQLHPKDADLLNTKEKIYPNDSPIDSIKPDDIRYDIKEALDFKKTISLMGCYINSSDNDGYDLEHRQILFCPINIERTAQYLLDMEGKHINGDDKQLSVFVDILSRMVFYHEMGHMIFRRLRQTQKLLEREKAANWVACLNYDAGFTTKIERLTVKLCEVLSEEYKDPIMFPDSVSGLASYHNTLKSILGIKDV